MAATGIFAEAVTAITNRITALGLVPVTDPRNARPLYFAQVGKDLEPVLNAR